MSWLTRVRIWHLVILAGLTLGFGQGEAAPASKVPVRFEYNGYAWTEEVQVQDVAEALIETFGSYENLAVAPVPETPLYGNTTIVVTDQTRLDLDHGVNKNLQIQLAAAQPKPEPTPIKKEEPVLAPKPKPKQQPPAEIFSGIATWYKNGDGLTTASRRWPKGTKVRVIAVNSGKTVDVVVNDYGPSAGTGVELDLNLPAFSQLASPGAGKIQIKYYKL